MKRNFKDYESSGNTGEDKEFNIKAILERNNIKDAVYVPNKRLALLISLSLCKRRDLKRKEPSFEQVWVLRLAGGLLHLQQIQ